MTSKENPGAPIRGGVVELVVGRLPFALARLRLPGAFKLAGDTARGTHLLVGAVDRTSPRSYRWPGQGNRGG